MVAHAATVLPPLKQCGTVDGMTNTDDWEASAACATVGGDWWFPEKDAGRNSAADAKRICMGCPVRVECLEYALARPWLEGVWGGLTERSRATLRTQRREVAA